MPVVSRHNLQQFIVFLLFTTILFSFGQLCYYLGQTNSTKQKYLFQRTPDLSSVTTTQSPEHGPHIKIDPKLEPEPEPEPNLESEPEPETQATNLELDESEDSLKPTTTEPPKKTKKSPPVIEYLEPPEKINSDSDIPYCFNKMNLKGTNVKIPIAAAAQQMKLTWASLNEKLDPRIQDGCWQPEETDCIIDQHLNIIVPYRNREEHLIYFTYYLHQYLISQKRSYCIILAEQSDNGQFNRAKLMNVGFLEAQKHRFWTKHKIVPDCFSFHDVDLIPDDDSNLYICHPEKTIHQCDKYDKYNYETQFASGRHVSAGGAALMSAVQYHMVNGHPNWYWGWGVEDIDMSIRLRFSPANSTENIGKVYTRKQIENLPIGATNNIYWAEGLTEDGGGPGLLRQDYFGKYTQLRHTHGFTNGPVKVKIFNELGGFIAKFQIGAFRDNRVEWDGLNQTAYKVKEYEYSKFYTRVNVEIRPAITNHLKLTMQHKAIFDITPSQFTEKDCRFVKLSNVVAITKVANAEDYPFHLKPFPEKLKTGLTKCYDMINNHGQCNMFSMIDFWVPKSIPYPLASKVPDKTNKHVTYDSFVRHCPAVIGWFQVAEKEVEIEIQDPHKTFEVQPGPFEYKLQAEIEVIELPIKGGLIYADLLVYEGERHSGRWLDLGNLPDLGSKLVKRNETEGLTVEIRHHQENIINLTIGIKFEKFVPGVGLFNHKILDYFGQPYFDSNIVFKTIGNTEDILDEQKVRDQYLSGLKRELEDEYPVEDHPAMRKELRKKIKQFFGVEDEVVVN